MTERYKWIVHKDVAETIDGLLRGREPSLQVRAVDLEGKVSISEQAPKVPELVKNPVSRGWRSTGRMEPLPLEYTPRKPTALKNRDWSDGDWTEKEEDNGNFNGSVEPLSVHKEEKEGEFAYIYLYAVSRHQAEEVIEGLKLPVVLTKDMDSADMILTLRSHVRQQSKLRQIAQNRSLPIHVIKSSTIPQITRAFRRMLQIDEPMGISPSNDLSLFAYGDSEDEMEALEETRLAVEQIVIPKGQPVELLPRSSEIRRMQHELVEHYHLKSTSFGNEPNRRLRIYPN